jgi:hypothetical protein
MQMGLFGLKRQEVAGGRERLYNKNLHNCYASSDVIRITNKGG